MIFNRKKILKTALIALFACVLSLSCFLLIGHPLSAKADGENYSVFLPNKSEEYHLLNSPIHAYSDTDITAITESTVLTVISGDEVILKSGRSSLNQVKRVSGNLYFNDYSRIYTLPTSDLSQEPQFTNLTGTYFDINENYIATIYESIIEIYKSHDFATPYKTISDVQNKPLAINSENLFYVSGNKIIKQALDEDNFGVAYTYDNSNAFSLSFMIANENYVYYLSENKIFRLPTDDRKSFPTELNFSDTVFDLGTITAPKGLSFKGENLLITDNAGSVQEFKINGNTLEFTGYAVASGLTAYNRVSATATDIERYGKYVAALDSNKLTVINTENCENYNKNGFINKFVGNAPALFALGNGTVAFLQGENISIAPVSESGTVKNVVSEYPATALNDISYQSGVYYFAYVIGTNTAVVKVSETTGEKIGDGVEFSGVAASVAAADVFGNVYAANETGVYKNDAATRFAFTGAKKLCSDLAGNLFALSSDGKIYKYDETAGEFSVAFETALGAIKSFGLNFDKSEVFFLINGYEQVFITTALNNSSLQDVVPDAAFNAATKSVKELKVYTAKSGANVYSVSVAENVFNFNGLINVAAEYPLMSKFVLSDNLTLYALASESGVVLINENDMTETTDAVDIKDYSENPEKAYVITSVYAYALPVIEQSGAFAINTDSDKIRLNKGVEISAKSEFDILGKTFYLAKVNVNGETKECYIPKSFTLKTLAKDVEFNEYSIEVVKDARVYKNADLTEEILTLDSGDSVRVLGEENGVLQVQATKNGETVIGYVSGSAIKSKPNTVIRNVLIILAVFGSLAGTLTYFLLRKRK